jgi:hypothetical protein
MHIVFAYHRMFIHPLLHIETRPIVRVDLGEVLEVVSPNWRVTRRSKIWMVTAVAIVIVIAIVILIVRAIVEAKHCGERKICIKSIVCYAGKYTIPKNRDWVCQ